MTGTPIHAAHDHMLTAANRREPYGHARARAWVRGLHCDGPMQSLGFRSKPPPTIATRGHSETPTIIMYAVPPDVASECQAIASELRIGRAEVKHLQQACAALEAHPRAFLIASEAIRPWDRHVLEEHAGKAGTAPRWVRSDGAYEDVAAVVRLWAGETLRRDRTGR